MMPVIRIPENVYQRLQAHAVPFVDTPATVIEKLLSAYEMNHSQPLSKSKADSSLLSNQDGTTYSDRPLHVASEKTANQTARYTIGGHVVSAFCKALGFQGYTAAQVWSLLPRLGLGAGEDGKQEGEKVTDSGARISWNTVLAQTGAGARLRTGGKPHHAGEPARLSEEQLAEVVRLIGEPERQ